MLPTKKIWNSWFDKFLLILFWVHHWCHFSHIINNLFNSTIFYFSIQMEEIHLQEARKYIPNKVNTPNKFPYSGLK